MTRTTTLSGQRKSKAPRTSRSRSTVVPTSVQPEEELTSLCGTVITDDEMQECHKILVDLMHHNLASPFNDPVDWQGYNLYTYPKIVKNPMDLGTIKEMLEHNALENPEHFAEHVHLVFENAKLFNLEGSDIHNSAVILLKHFDSVYEETCQRWRAEAAETERMKEMAAAEQVGSVEDKTELQVLNDTIEQVKAEITGLKDSINELKKTSKPINNIRRVKLTRPRPPLTYKNKEDICSKITSLGEEDLPGFLELIRGPSKGDEEKPFEINMEELDDETLLKIQRYVTKCLKNKKQAK
eukprot:TRINITY_DN17222_c0_g1_i1.p1 TRINITY_DN17222_c0_g1~~TRINITY_DN17222_c0_g1_i1.p1  ORF type:complete len:297 (-),score=66.02 TRINITY_DN17222_c0_g1_i1:125-1015(-)